MLISEKVETSQIFIHRSDEKNVLYSCKGILYGHEKWTVATWNNMDESK